MSRYIIKRLLLMIPILLGISFIVLILISFVISAFSLINKAEARRQKKEAPVKAPADNQPTAAPAAVEEEDVTDDTELVAVIAAAIAAYEGTSVEGLVVRSIRKINRNENWRRG